MSSFGLGGLGDESEAIYHQVKPSDGVEGHVVKDAASSLSPAIPVTCLPPMPTAASASEIDWSNLHLSSPLEMVADGSSTVQTMSDDVTKLNHTMMYLKGHDESLTTTASTTPLLEPPSLQDINMSLASDLQRHLLHSTSNLTESSASVKRSSATSFLPDLGLAATDPKNILLLPDVKTASLRSPGDCEHGNKANAASFPSKNLSSPGEVPSSHGFFSDVPSECQLDLAIPSSPVAATFTTKIKSQRQAFRYDAGKPILDPCYTTSTMSPTELTSKLTSHEPVRLLPDVARTTSVSLRSTPAIRLVPSAVPAANLSPNGTLIKVLPVTTCSGSLPGVRMSPRSKESPILIPLSTKILPSVTRVAKTEVVQQVSSHSQPPRAIRPEATSTSSSDLSGAIKMDHVSSDNTLQHSRKQMKIETVSCYKCTECGFVAAGLKTVQAHQVAEHDADAASDNDEATNWMVTAQKEGIALECPLCPNKFMAEGSRSFKAHVIDDHGVEEAEAEARFSECYRNRRDKTLALIKQQRHEERLRRMETNQDQFEAYVDEHGELRVRSCNRRLQSAGGNQSTNDVDVSAAEFVKTFKSEVRKVGQSRSDLVAKDCEVSSVVNEQSRKTRRKTMTEAAVGVQTTRSHVGRPRGSRNLGITKLKRIDPSITLSTDGIGQQCGISECAVRLKDPAKLEYHRKCHSSDHPGKFRCCECFATLDTWPQLALHLWRSHRVDLELLACSECNNFRSFTMARLEAHQLTHRSERPFLCDFCGKSFKSEKNLKTHKLLHDVKSNESPRKASHNTCSICNRTFREVRLLKLHMDTVHRKLRPHLCNFCGYSASSKSSLKLHLRQHTGDKYSCNSCDYRTSDHNSLRRHRMRHSGEKAYRCPHCAYSSIQSSTYKAHLKSKHPQQASNLVFNCSACLFTTVQEEKYLTHVAGCNRSVVQRIVEPDTTT